MQNHHHQPTAKPKALAVLTQTERATFLPPALWEALTHMLPELVHYDPADPDFNWSEILRKEKPEILIAAWKAPRLPENYANLTDGQLSYVCYLPGSLRNLLDAKMLRDGLLATNWGNAISRTVAECGLMMAIACLRRAHQWALDMHLHGKWKDSSLVSASLFERRVGLHGYGAIAQELRKLLEPFDVSVMTYSPSVPDDLLASHSVARAASLEELFANNEVIFELAALTPKSRGMVGEKHLRMIPQGGVFINIGRGAVVDEEALLRVAQSSDLQIALDVYGKEPLTTDHPFRGQRNIMLLPHISGPTMDRRQDSGRLAVQNIGNYIEGKPLESVITAEVYERST